MAIIPAYYKDGVPYDASGKIITTSRGKSSPEPLVTSLGDGKFKFRSVGKACYQGYVNTLGLVWMMDRSDGKGWAMCYATNAEKKVAVKMITGVMPVPEYTPEQVQAAMTVLGGPLALTLNSGQWGMQLSVAGEGAMVVAGELLSPLKTAFARAVSLLTASVVGPMALAASTILFSSPAGGGSAQVPGRDWNAVLALNARMMAERSDPIIPGSATVNLPVRAALVYEDGQMELKLIKTGEGVPSAVPVLNAVRDNATGLDIITVPAVAGGEPQTILLNPAPAPAKPSDTGNQEPVPVTPKYTGTAIRPVEKITVLPFPVENVQGLRDFIYWRPDAEGTGVQPVYVVLSNPYGETNAKGKYSGREYNTDKAGGPILELDWRTTTIDQEGVDKVKLHISRFEESPENKVMIERLEKILNGELDVTDTDKRFYTHEVRELERYRNLGIKDGTVPENDFEVWNNTHTATLEDYQLLSDETLLYTPEALNAYK